MAVLFNEKYVSSSIPTEIFERLRVYSNVNLSGFTESDPNKLFFVYSENDKYYINRKDKLTLAPPMKRVNMNMSAELELRKMEGGKTEITYTINGQSKTYHNILFFVVFALSVPLIILSDLYTGIIFLALLPLVFIFRRYKNKILSEYKNEYLELYERLK